jgi:hypothetical protein
MQQQQQSNMYTPVIYTTKVMQLEFFCRQGIVSQILKMDPVERIRRLKRSFEGHLSFRKIIILACVGFAFLLYFGPTFFGWLFGWHPRIHSNSLLRVTLGGLKTAGI